MKRLRAMFSRFTRSRYERPNPDPISASVTIAVQRNERAGENARELLNEMLNRNDSFHRSR